MLWRGCPARAKACPGPPLAAVHHNQGGPRHRQQQQGIALNARWVKCLCGRSWPIDGNHNDVETTARAEALGVIPASLSRRVLVLALQSPLQSEWEHTAPSQTNLGLHVTFRKHVPKHGSDGNPTCKA